MNLSQLEVFVAIVETGSFTEAANRVGVTRSAASHAIANLEAELGVTLVERDRGQATPTTAGNCMLGNAREILANIENIRQEAARARGLQAGKLRIGIVSSISSAIWSGMLRKFRQEYSGIEVVTLEGSGYEVEDWILTNVVDVGFVLRPVEGIDSTMIGQDEVRVVIPAGHPLRKKQSVHLEALAHEPFILPKIACDFLDSAWHGADYVEMERRYEATEVQTILTMVHEGLGISMLPEMLLPPQVEGLRLLSLDPPLRFNFGLGVRSGRITSPAARTFLLTAQSWAHANGFDTPSAASETVEYERVTVEA